MTLPPRVVHAGRRLLVGSAYVLPILLLAHAIGFWGRGIIDKEALTFVVNYLADRPLLAAVFDPQLNDWGLYQARELSYLFDLVDARVFAALLDRHILLFVPVSGALGLASLAAVHQWGARRVLRLDGVTASLLLSIFLSCTVTQASTAILYRSSKIVLSAALLAFLFALARLLIQRDGPRRASVLQLAGLGLLGFAMSLCDRQGFYFLVVATATVAALWVFSLVHRPGGRTNHFGIILSGVGASVMVTLYNNVFAPAIVHSLNGYWPDFSYQQLPLDTLDVATLARQAWAMFRAQASLYFGNWPFVLVGTAGITACAVAAWRRRTADVVVVAFAICGSLVMLLAVMILRHPAVFTIPDHGYWYYTLPLHAVLLFAVTLLLYVAGGPTSAAGKAALVSLALLMVAGNAWHYAEHRSLMVSSVRWFRNQYNRSMRLVNDFEAMQGRVPKGDRSPDSWLRVGPDGAIVELPIGQQGFLEGVQAAYATLKGRRPLADAGGPHWAGLRGFLVSAATPLNEPNRVDDVLRAFRSIGVRQVVFNRDRFQDQALARASIAAALASTSSVLRSSDDGRVATIQLKDAPEPRADQSAERPIPRRAFGVATSISANRIPLLFDGNPDTRWLTGRPQGGDEWIRIEFDGPRDVARVRLETAERSLGDYPRALVVTSGEGDQAKILYAGSPLGMLMKGLLREPRRAPIEIGLPPNQTVVLILRQTGQTRTWYWSIHELTLRERVH